jgi:hypothetical protein
MIIIPGNASPSHRPIEAHHAPPGPRPVYEPERGPEMDRGWLSAFFALPFTPSLWAQAAWLPWWRAAIPVYVLTLLVSLVIGYAGSSVVGQLLNESAETYVKNGWAPVVISPDGKVSLEGDKPPVYKGNGYLFAIDPNNTIDLSNAGRDNYLIIRKDKIVQQTAGANLFGGKESVNHQERELKELEPMLGKKEIRIDGHALKAFAATNGPVLRAIAFILFAGMMTVSGWITAPIYAITAAWLVHSFAAKRRGLTFGQCFNIAMAAVAPKVLIDTILMLGGISFSGVGPFLPYVALTTILTLWAIAKAVPARPATAEWS